MSSKRRSGFTLIEMVIAIVIISVGLAGVLSAYNAAVKSSGDPMIHKQMLAIAEEMMEEILLKSYSVGAGTITGCARNAADDIFDYGAYTNQPVCDIDGNAVPGLSGYTVSVTQASVTLASAVPATKITITVAYGGKTITLAGWRTGYAL